MPGDRAELDRLVEQGLALYGQGDLDGALLAWEEVLAIDPTDPQANSYVDYVRLNYDLLTGAEPPDAAAQAPFAIASDEAPEHRVEVAPGELEQVRHVIASTLSAEGTPLYAPPSDELDEGWAMDDEPRAAAPAAPPPLTLELDAEVPAPSAAEVNFEDATREYDARQAGMPPPAGAAPAVALVDAPAIDPDAAAEFASEGTPGFDAPTDVRTRDLGFVRPTGARAAVAPPDDAPAAGGDLDLELAPPSAPARSAASISSRVTLDFGGAGAHRAPAAIADALGAPPAVSIDAFELDDSPVPPPPMPPVLPPTRDLGTDVEARPTLQLDPVISAPTRELGMRPGGRISGEAAALAVRGGETQADVVLPFDPIVARAAQILDEVDEGAPLAEARDDQARRRVAALLERAMRWAAAGELDRAATAVELALAEDPDSALAQKLIQRHRDDILGVFQAFLGELDRTPVLARPMHELASAPISPRAAFLLSRIDGTLTLDEILDVSGMPRLEAYRHLAQLFLRGILR